MASGRRARKINHFMTRAFGVCKHAREALVAGSEFVKLFARNGDEAPPWPEDGLTRTGSREDAAAPKIAATSSSSYRRSVMSVKIAATPTGGKLKRRRSSSCPSPHRPTSGC